MHPGKCISWQATHLILAKYTNILCRVTWHPLARVWPAQVPPMATMWQMNTLRAGPRHFQVIQELLWCFGSLIIWSITARLTTDHHCLVCTIQVPNRLQHLESPGFRITKNVEGHISTFTFLGCSYEIFTKHKHILVTPTTISAQCSWCPNPVTHRAFWVRERVYQHPFLYCMFQSLLSIFDSVSQTFSPSVLSWRIFSHRQMREGTRYTTQDQHLEKPSFPHPTGHYSGACWELYQGSCGRILLQQISH